MVFKVNNDKLKELLINTNNVRNVAIVDNFGERKDILFGHLANYSITSDSETATIVGQQGSSTGELSSIPLHYKENDSTVQLPESTKGKEFLINAINAQSHLDLSSGSARALSISDGALFVVDPIGEVSATTSKALRQAIDNGIVPTLFINKIDRLIYQMMMDGENTYLELSNILSKYNNIIGSSSSLSSPSLDPLALNVAFGNVEQGWGFTLDIWAKKTIGTSTEGISGVPKLWGDNYFDIHAKEWSTKLTSGSVRGFTYLLFTSLKVLLEDPANPKVESRLKINLTESEKALPSNQLAPLVMRKLFNLEQCVLGMVVQKVPSPVTSQGIRTNKLYGGNGTVDKVDLQVIQQCNSNGPMFFQVSKVVRSTTGTVYSYGRVFSGFVLPGQKLVVLNGLGEITIESCPAGNLVALVGIDTGVSKTSTLTNSDKARTISTIKYSMAPLVSMTITVKSASLTKFNEKYKANGNSDVISTTVIRDGEALIGGPTKQTLDQYLADLLRVSVETTSSTPMTCYCETVSDQSMTSIATSSNKKNSMTFKSEPIVNELAPYIESEQLAVNIVDRPKRFQDSEWEADHIKAICSFGPNGYGTNILVNLAKNYLVMDSIIQSFQSVTSQGSLCDEPMRGVRFNLTEAKISSDVALCGDGQIIPAAKRALLGAHLAGSVCPKEPFYNIEVTVPHSISDSIMHITVQHQGSLEEELDHYTNKDLTVIRVQIPVAHSFGFIPKIQADTNDKAQVQVVFGNWVVIDNNPFFEGSPSNKIVKAIRTRKGLSPTLPTLDSFEFQ
ncbi:hypothetical protein SAMD00019534_098990 [Acytostelium subglobosum LB1]|uniref:hypothetical protein n=1 Tax=Acytostelium subglobosum LB1 TaxID=1410327 RepID=UPI000644F080|nr:hypothetical protein SAMD00019534_098990 [Acytostelium subglobosum LB1]GAM26724.1 hypothetical protein SAMD00019534_098990 [Acytostelium subglobosum LB1]|eukprot:XP_012750385.1 hypothetical protein SAMD00019534_098990 [Acytostelium subglobosum LB1]